MTNRQAITVLKKIIAVAEKSSSGIKEIDGTDEEAIQTAIKALEQDERAEEWYKLFVEKLEQDSIAQERYEDLCEYFGGSEDILKNRDDFKAWLDRVKWHVRKAEELYEKYEREPSGDLISREMALKECYDIVVDGERYRVIQEETLLGLPPVKKTGHWIEKDGFDGDVYYDCSECNESFCLIDGTPTDNLFDYCPNCGARMVEQERSE